MSSTKNGEVEREDVHSENDASLSRRKFLKRGAAAGIGAAVLYVAPTMSSTKARRAYATLTGAPPCEDTIPPVITITSSLSFNLFEGGIYFVDVDVTDDVALESIKIDIPDLGVSAEKPIVCANLVTSDSLQLYQGGASLTPVGNYSGTVTAVDCCGNTSTLDFTLNLANVTPGIF